MKNPNTPIAAIIKDLQISQAQFADMFLVDATTINRFVNGHRNVGPELAIEINKKLPNYSIDFILGKSQEKMDEASSITKTLSEIFDEITTVSTTSIFDKNEKGEDIPAQLLIFSMNEHLYNLLLKYDHASKLKDQGMKSYADEISKINKEYIKNKSEGKTIKCLVIPSNRSEEIIESEERKRKSVREIVDLAMYEDTFKTIKLDENFEKDTTDKK